MFNVFGRRARTFRAASGYLSLIGAGELITISQLGFDNGLYLLLFPGGIACGFLVLGAVGWRVRDDAARLGATTMAGYVSAAYGRPAARALALAYTLSLGALLTVQFIVGGQLLAATAGISPHAASIILAAIIIIYLEVGGLVAVLSTDILRTVFMTVILVVLVVPLYAVFTSGHSGPPAAYAPLPPLDAGMLFVLGFFGAVCAGDVWQTIIASESRRVIGRSMIIAAVAFVVLGMLIGVLGLAAKHVVATVPSDSSALIVAVKGVLPVALVPLATLLIAGAIMATADTEIWVVSTTLVTALGVAAADRDQAAAQERLRKRTQWVIPLVTVAALGLTFIGESAQVVYNALLALLTALAPGVIAIIFRAARPLGIAVCLWGSLAAYAAINIYWAMQPPTPALLAPIAVGLAALLFSGLLPKEVEAR
jgi:Na+/proline symporter